MQGNTAYRKKIIRSSYTQLIGISIIVSIICCLISYTLKHLTGQVQEYLFEEIMAVENRLLIFLPSVGITAIYFLRKCLFQNRKNKGVKEIYTTLETRKDHLIILRLLVIRPTNIFVVHGLIRRN